MSPLILSSRICLFLLCVFPIVFFLSSCGSYVPITPQGPFKLVDEASKTIDKLIRHEDLTNIKKYLSNAAGVAIFPATYKAGFIFGAEGGNGVLIAREQDGIWGYPAFYSLVGGSWGLQAGAERSSLLLIIRNNKAVESIVRHQGKLGADIGMAVGTIGRGMGGATTTNLAADILTFSDSMGLFGGVSLEGTAMIKRNDLNQQFYGKKVDIRSIIFEHAHKNKSAEDLRLLLKTISNN